MVGITGISLSSEELKTQDVEQNEKLDSTTNMFTNAAAATDKEHKMTLWQGCKLYPKAILWSVLISSCCAMEGYDISLTPLILSIESMECKEPMAHTKSPLDGKLA
ncbi:MFS transporter, SP family, general alpha glucoside:H+ symporter [Cryptococcus neoformans Ze90-1]|nr:MFS transporter, SP family, general alpha glucoside:H+ symporter [Cryptococcus neoformans var. grubii Ze90-1]